MELCEVVERIEAEGGKLFLRYGRYFGSAYSDVLDASAELGSIHLSVTTEKLGWGSRLTEEHEKAIATMLAPVVGFVPDASRFRVQFARQSCPQASGCDAAERLKRVGATDVRFAAYGSRHSEGVWLEAVVEIHGVQYRIDTRAHGEAPESEHEYVLDWHLNFFAMWLEKLADSR